MYVENQDILLETAHHKEQKREKILNVTNVMRWVTWLELVQVLMLQI